MNQTTEEATESVGARPRVAIITCAVLELEVAHYCKALPNVVHVELLEQGLHNEPPKLRCELQKAIDRVERIAEVEAIVLGYGLCSRGIEGVSTLRAKLVVARAHDCITLLLGSKERYAEYVARFPGTYWYSPGWNKHHVPPGKERYDRLYQEYVQKYGEDNAQFLMETEQAWFSQYSRATYVDLTVGATDADIRYTQDCAQWLKWDFDHQKGDPGLLTSLLAGSWNPQDVLVLEPHQTVRPTADERVMEAVPAKGVVGDLGANQDTPGGVPDWKRQAGACPAPT